MRLQSNVARSPTETAKLKLMLPTFWLAALLVRPPNLQPPEGQTLLLHVFAKGDQVYTCKQSPTGWAWTLKEPDAQLRNDKGELVGRHFAGPTWAAEDGSRVVGKPVSTQPSPDANSVPWLLLTASDHIGNGAMAPVLSVQRLNTKGGKAPADGCDASHSEIVLRVPYSAEYFFYGAANSK